MCGIAGVYKFYSKDVDEADLNKMIVIQNHRGPDDSKTWIHSENKIGFGHNRLRIIDLSQAASQPMTYQGLYTITYNGELYNYKPLKEKLQQKGYQFNSQSDTEVLLAMYAEFGIDCLQHLDGMFAFAIWDEKKQRLFCARDRFGEKPFHYYYSAPQGNFVFASEIKTLFASGLVPKEFNYRMVYHFLANEMVENPFNFEETFYDNISRLEAAHYLIIDGTGRLQKGKYWELKNETNHSISEKDAVEKFQELFLDSVRTRLQADVPFGTSLSGGLDSSSILCAARQHYKGDLKAFSARFKDAKLDEGKYIEAVVKHAQVKSIQTTPDENTFLDSVEKILYYQEEPFSSASIVAQWEVMKLAANNDVKVLIDGQGSDEYLAGYTHFHFTYLKELFINNRTTFYEEVRNQRENINPNFSLGLQFYFQTIFPASFDKLQSFKNTAFGSEKDKFLHYDFFRQYQEKQNPFNNFLTLKEATNYFTTQYGLHKLLRFADRSSMAHSIEVRLPFLNHNLVEFTHSLPADLLIKNGWSKYVLRKSMEPYLPQEITWRKDKLGFQAPQLDWLKSPTIQPIMHEATQWMKTHHILNKKYKKEYSWLILIMYLFLRK